MESVEPQIVRAPHEEGGELHAPDSLTMRFSGDIRNLLMAGRTFVMQVAHPSVGAGVWEMSAFREDPWHRLREIDRSGNAMIYEGPAAAAAEGKRLRYLHRHIAGVDGNGRRYHSLEPDVYGWVHMVFIDSTVTMNALYGTPLTRAEEERLFIEWRQGGRYLGLRDRDMPATLDDYWATYRRAIDETLEYNEAVDYILRADALAKPKFLSTVSDEAWARIWKPLGAATRKVTMSALHPAFRRKIRHHQPWTARDEAEMRRFQRLVRATVPRLPERLRVSNAARRAACPM